MHRHRLIFADVYRLVGLASLRCDVAGRAAALWAVEVASLDVFHALVVPGIRIQWTAGAAIGKGRTVTVVGGARVAGLAFGRAKRAEVSWEAVELGLLGEIFSAVATIHV